ncbi:putative S-protein [Cardamine amara subsp. amara]|uniref:S-protein homolog n=1 Tax=Cardamine amara subsp. amara TaxID=228776 RepID=A0ABD1B7T1_CARAN
MAFSNKPHYILMFMVSSILVLFATALDVSNVTAEAPSSGSRNIPPVEKHVIIHNIVANGQPLNVHCKSNEKDFGMIQIPLGSRWGFRFLVNSLKTTKVRCHITWYKGGDHYFDIFKVSRDDDPYGMYPICNECIWDVGNRKDYPMCRLNYYKLNPYCFKWDG